jgi:hypothetical protein
MSKLKTPRQKKLASLALDRRSVYWENDKASRKLVPRRKQEGGQELRRAANQPLQALSGQVDDDRADLAEAVVAEVLIDKRRKGFKKKPDAPLGACMKEKTEGWIPPWEGGDPLGVYREVLDPRKRKLDRS